MVLFLLAACIQMPVNSAEPGLVIPVPRQERRINQTDKYLYCVEIYSDVWFSLLFNGMELLVFEGSSSFAQSIVLNDWMIPGENTLSIDISPLGKNKTGVYSFVLKKQRAEGANEFELYTFNPGSGNRVSWTFTEKNFPFTLIEKADRLVSVPSHEDQKEIAEIVDSLRSAFTAKDIDTVTALLQNKNDDIASVRFLPASEYRKTSAGFYADLMNKQGFAVKPPPRRIYTFSLTMDRRLVAVMQGREGFPEAAVILNYQENGKPASHELNLYFAKVSGRWIIIR